MAGLISNGTYVLGDPNTRDLYLGKGLKQGVEDDKWYIAADETALWEGSSNMKDIPTFNLSESFKNFEYIEIFGKAFSTHAETSYLKFSSASFTEGVTIYMPYKGGGSIVHFGVAFIGSSSDTVLKIQTGSAFQITIQSGSSVVATPQSIITKIVGINRKRG